MEHIKITDDFEEQIAIGEKYISKFQTGQRRFSSLRM